MIVRILGEGQFTLPGAAIDGLNAIDNRMVDAVAVEDEGLFRTLLVQMHDLVLEHGEAVPVDELVESDIIVPGLDLTLEEAEHIFIGDGLVPG